ncbi:MAG: FKBP-type peptidyl-prolyl cis-trans isomerase [Bacteroidetes bacterium]|nr:FKBP-type peptidyl-prolyl cis-trans isomerase [Bacteroidota bacterium]
MMQRLSVLLMCLIFVVSAYTQQPKSDAKKTMPKKKTISLKSNEDKMSYLSGYDLGLKVGSNVKSSNFPFRTAAFVGGITEALEGFDNRLTPEEIQHVVEIFQKMNPQADDQKKLAGISAKYKKEGEEFLVVNGKKDSVKTTASGLQYKILREGTGKSPMDTNTVTVHYRGRLINGVIFDESYGRGEPTSFRLNQVIRGWTEGLQLMKEGAKYEFYIPNNLAYGEQPAGQLIPPGSTLIFEVELIAIQ